jgi:glucose-1-phosphate adenylyltransferase
VIENSILMPGVQVGRHARVRNAIVDRDVLVPRGAVIGHDLAEDRRRHTVTERGIVVVTVDEDAQVAPIDEDALSIEAGVDKA